MERVRFLLVVLLLAPSACSEADAAPAGRAQRAARPAPTTPLPPDFDLEAADVRESLEPRAGDGRPLRTRRRKPLSKQQLLSKFAKTFTDFSWAKLNPGKPRKVGRAALVFVGPELVEGGEGYADFADHCVPDEVYSAFKKDGVWRKKRAFDPGLYCPDPGRAVLWVNSPGSKEFLVDCDVDVIEESRDDDSWTLTTGGGLKTTLSSLPVDDHLVFTMHTHPPGWYAMSIQGTHDRWRMFGCTVHMR